MDAMNGVGRMMRMHIDKILNYFTHGIKNAKAAGINSKITLIEKKPMDSETVAFLRRQNTSNAETWTCIYDYLHQTRKNHY